MDGLQIRITRCIVIAIGRLSKQQQDIRRGHSLTPQTFALLPEMACCWRGCDSRSWRYSIDFCQRLCQLVQLTVKVTSLVIILAVNHHVNPNYGR